MLLKPSDKSGCKLSEVLNFLLVYSQSTPVTSGVTVCVCVCVCGHKADKAMTAKVLRCHYSKTSNCRQTVFLRTLVGPQVVDCGHSHEYKQ